MTRRRLSSFPRLRPFPRLGTPRFRLLRPVLRAGGRLLRFLFRSQILPIFLGLSALGFFVGAQTRPAPGSFPWGELFDQLQVASYRDAPGDTSSRFVVELCAGGRVFSQYDVERREFLPPPRGRSYSQTITGTRYEPLRVRGHVGTGFWLDVPSRRSLLPDQYDELYRRTLDFVRPVSKITAVLGVLSGYSVGYRLGTWNGSLSSRAVQQRVLDTPDIGRLIAREAWRRVLLEPVVMTGEQDASRFVSVASTHRLYANFFRLALNDGDGFIPREAARLEAHGHGFEARTMRAFAAAVERASQDTVHVTNADFEAVERWATLLDRRGHWIEGAIPPPGEERIKLMGALAWYGLAPPGQNVDRVWVGPRMLVRVGDAEGFVADEIPGTGAGCPISWRPRLREENGRATAMVSAWLADRPEFSALAVFGRRLAERLRDASAPPMAPGLAPAIETAGGHGPGADAAFAVRAPIVVQQTEDRPRQAYEFRIPATGGEASLQIVAADSSQAMSLARAARSVMERQEGFVDAPSTGAPPAMGDVDAALQSLSGHRMTSGRRADETRDTLRAHGVRNALIELPGAALALGVSPGGEPWSAGLPDPRGRMPVIARLRLAAGQALASSSRQDPAKGLIGVVVVAGDGRSAALWSATLISLDPGEARAKAKQQPGIAVALIEAGVDGPDVIWVEVGLEDRLVVGGQAQGLFKVVTF
ncbi:MAG TPA: FAD:protein FMN transferase [Candidatus Eisenbacteria bacterium]|nr:FAD:protein FMN transferase [Candidatus Eisenbacteria bacterium]